jgi:hypothetical protein
MKRFKISFLATVGLVAVASLFTVCKAVGSSPSVYSTVTGQTIGVGYGEFRALDPTEKTLLDIVMPVDAEDPAELGEIALSDGNNILGIKIGEFATENYTVKVYDINLDGDDNPDTPVAEAPEWPLSVYTVTFDARSGISATVDGVPVESGSAPAAAGQTVVFTLPAVSGKRGNYTLTKTAGGAADVPVTQLFESSDDPIHYLYELSGGERAINISGYQGSVVERALLWLNGTAPGEAATWSFLMPAYNTTINAQFTAELAGCRFEIRLDAGQELSPQTLGGGNLPNITGTTGSPVSITILARAPASADMRYIDLASQGTLFTLASDAGLTLILGKNIALRGLCSLTVRAATNIASGWTYWPGPDGTYSGIDLDNSAPLVLVQAGNTLVMAENAQISGNTNMASTVGGGVVADGGALVISGADAAVHHNIAASDNDGSNNIPGGGGVYVVNGGSLTMSGANAAVYGNYSSTFGGGVGVNGSSSTFNMSGTNAAIYGNIGHRAAQGVVVWNNGTFNMSGAHAEIYGNGVNGLSAQGGGVGVFLDGTFNMSGGTVYGMSGSTYPLGTVSAEKANMAMGPTGGGKALSGTVTFLKNGYVGNTAKSAGETISDDINDTLYVPE